MTQILKHTSKLFKKACYLYDIDLNRLDMNGFEPLSSWQDALRRYLKEVEV
jgi:hypothetical protein